MNKNKSLIIILSVLLYVVSAGVSYTLFSKTGLADSSVNTAAPKTVNGNQQLVFDTASPKTEACPLNGAMFSKQQKSWWEKHRPLGVMIENHVDARPQSGISFADVTYEAVAEGGITRTLNVFYCQDAGIIGPVRSARTYFLDFISEYGNYPLYAHVGGANTPGPADALGQIDSYGWGGYNDLNQFSVGFPTYWRDEARAGHPVATEHTMYSSTGKLWEVGAKRNLTNVDKDGKSWDTSFTSYSFKDDAPVSGRPASQKIHVDFWNGSDYAVDWTYDKASNSYLRDNGGVPHIDRDTKAQLSAKDVVVLFMTEEHANDGYEINQHMLYGTKGTGKALIFMDGKQVKATWSKKNRTAHLVLTTTGGDEVKLTRGHIWFEVQPLDGAVIVK